MFTETNPTNTRRIHAISVSELNRQARTLLERSFLTIQVEGEISNFVRPSSGHWYFTLKDDKAQVRCAMFKNRNQLIKPAPKQGDKVVVRAKVSLYEGRGDYQLICDFMESSGSGSLQAAFEELKLKLQAEGLFDSKHKKPIPAHPSHIGIITSKTGAAVHDILTVLKRRFPGLPITIYPTSVQGDEAPAQICKAIILAEVHQTCDVLILGRGGGSLEDLWAFNTEDVARTVFDCDIPIISAVGHEVDVVITDFIADTRAPTPSAAAEMLSPDQHQLKQRLALLEQRLIRHIEQKLKATALNIQHSKTRLRHPGQKLNEQAQRLDHLEAKLLNGINAKIINAKHQQQQLLSRVKALSPTKLLPLKEEQIHSLQQRLTQSIHTLLQQKSFKLGSLSSQLNTVSPLATLERGYAIVKDEHGTVIQDASTTQKGDVIESQLYKGRLRCRVDEVITE
ncbi:exodeoxyribonuclease VII large subunit [Neptuniibacter sp. 1_MG-2023]|uniref:exodeoxyribonuclease VII large subunit n=1 Tax=Neptuniibacter sp. 1_MG-2023 TaxID=3062662 RepID=UPI0026E3E649|nr:exodeoxyribonuclease VII large subunit [Neptuniibacter sp. 1_MG-2023]MDO6592853.1 exodeoxyribonuclease VII large subunit [Neptuniibacter sp. 1_MG-2023]